MPIYRRFLGSSWLEAFGATALSHPIVWFVIFSPSFHAGYGTKAVLAEGFAWASEALYFRLLFDRRRAFLVALLANAASVLLGFVSRALFGGP